MVLTDDRPREGVPEANRLQIRLVQVRLRQDLSRILLHIHLQEADHRVEGNVRWVAVHHTLMDKT